MTTRGRIFDVSKGCVHDGPGLRTVVFMKGCALGCSFCHNPEGLAHAPQIAFDATRCIRCGRCVVACPRNPGAWSLDEPDAWRDGCDACGRCVDACPSGARRRVGRDVGVDQLVRELAADADFFAGTGGGVTFSGGEPMLQAEFVLECAARLAAENIHVAVETAGLWPARHAPPLAERADLVLFDLKHGDPDALRRRLGVDASAIFDNLAALVASDVTLELRVTLVPGFNTAPEDLAAIARAVARLPRAPAVTLQPFHRLAAGKAALHGAAYAWAGTPPPGDAELAAAAHVLEDLGVELARA